MNRLIKTPGELLALVIVIGCIILMAFGIDGEVKSILAMAAAWAFRGAYQAGAARKQHNGKT